MGLVLGIDVAYKTMGIAVAEVRLNLGVAGVRHGNDFELTSVGVALTERLVAVAALKADETTSSRKRHADMFVADKDYLGALRQADQLLDFILQTNPDIVVMELPSAGAKGARANRCMGIATGIVAALPPALRRLGRTDCPFLCRAPGDGKYAATGKRSGTKDEVEMKVRQCYAGADGLLATIKAADVEHVCDATAAIWAIRGSDEYLRCACATIEAS
jgi:hypothetical protein